MPDWLVTGVAQLVGVAVVTALVHHRFRPREAAAPDGGRARSLECWARVVSGQHPRLVQRWRVGRAVVSDGTIELTLYRWGLRFRKQEPFVLEVGAVHRDGVRRPGWRACVLFAESHRVVPVTATRGAQVEIALSSGEVDVVLDVLEGRSPPEAPAAADRAHGSAWFRQPRAAVTSRPVPPGNGSDDDITAQLSRCLDDVAEQLARSGLSLSDLVHLQVRTTDPHAVSSHIGVIATRLREVGAMTPIGMLAVGRLTAPDQVVQLEATAAAS